LPATITTDGRVPTPINSFSAGQNSPAPMENLSPLKLYTQEQRRAGMRSLVLLHLRKHGGLATARTVAYTIGKALKHVWPRFTELAASGAIRDTGERVNQGRGRPQVVWQVVQADKENVTVQDEADAPNWFKEFGN
jgi:hypothetical protein